LFFPALLKATENNLLLNQKQNRPTNDNIKIKKELLMEKNITINTIGKETYNL